MFFDTHAHLDDERFDDDRSEIIKMIYDSGVTHVLNASYNIASSYDSIALANENKFIFAAVGIHPHNAEEADDNTLVKLTELSKNKKVVAIGEIGLDYYYDNSPREVQQKWFAEQISLARQLKLPVLIHDRDAHEDSLNIIKSEKAHEVGGVFHCFSGSVEMAKVVLKNEFYISIAGPVTFKNARKLVEVVDYVPLDRLLIETDCPYLSPEPFRGKRNDPSNVRYTAQKIADIKGLTLEEIAHITMNNAKKLFGVY